MGETLGVKAIFFVVQIIFMKCNVHFIIDPS